VKHKTAKTKRHRVNKQKRRTEREAKKKMMRGLREDPRGKYRRNK